MHLRALPAAGRGVERGIAREFGSRGEVLRRLGIDQSVLSEEGDKKMRL
jgi:hypothetical protein